MRAKAKRRFLFDTARQFANFSRRVANRACSLWRRSARVVTIVADSLSALDDQAMAGVIMWVPGSLVFLVAATWLAMEALGGARAVRGVASSDSYGFGASGAS